MRTVKRGLGDGPCWREMVFSATAQSRGVGSSNATVSVTGAMAAPPTLVASIRTRLSFEVNPLAGTMTRSTNCATWPGARTIGFASGVAPSGRPSPFASGKSATEVKVQPPTRSVAVTVKLSGPLPVFVSVVRKKTVAPGRLVTRVLAASRPPKDPVAEEPTASVVVFEATAVEFPPWVPEASAWFTIEAPGRTPAELICAQK